MNTASQKPIVERVKEYIPDTNDVKNAVQNTTKAVSNRLESVKNGIRNTLDEFSQKGVMNASNEFLESNSLFAKFAFLILVLILFLFLFKIGVGFISYFQNPSSDPYLVKGTVDGNSTITISQNPAVAGSIPIVRSINGNSGVEFTWSIWLLLQYNQGNYANSKVDTIFVKGANNFNADGKNSVNGPGLYAVKQPNGFIDLMFIMDDINGNQFQNIITVNTLPLNKWVHLALRLENTILDVYTNGIISQRLQMRNAPKQNFYDVLVSPNGGFQGKLSNLQYFSRALNVFEINNIVMFGPNLTNSSLSSAAGNAKGNYSYLSNIWYNNWYNSV
jgi:hypothetical protein